MDSSLYSYIRSPTSLVRILLAAGANTDIKNWLGQTLVHRAVFDKRIDLVSLLVNTDIDIDANSPDETKIILKDRDGGAFEFPRTDI